MYFWNIEKLKQDIKNGGLSESMQFKYFLIWIILTIFAELSYVDSNFSDIKYEFATDLLFTILGTIYLYKCNGGANGKDFLQKYISIGLVVFFRIILYFIAFMILLTILLAFSEISDAQYDNLVNYIITPILLLVYYWRAGIHIKDVAK